MRSAQPKALHVLGGQSLLAHVMTAANAAGTGNLAIVVGPDHGAVAAEASRHAPKAQIFEQRERRGTAHAVLSAAKAIGNGADDVLVIFADTPLVRAEALSKLRGALADGNAVAVLGFNPVDPRGYGRLVMRGDELVAIREDRDATPEERKIRFCNGGLMALAGKHALPILKRIDNSNAKGEFYLTDAVAIAREMGLKAVAIETLEDDVCGINTKAQLAEAEAVLQKRLRAAALEAGVTMVAPETVFLSADTKFGKDVTIEPNVVFGPGVSVDDGAMIRSFSHLEGAHVGKNARVGPFARLRPGADLGRDVHIGNFVEIKAAKIEQGAKANHLAYIGDRASVPTQMLALARSPATMTALPSIIPISAKAPSSVRIRRWSHLLRLAMAPISAQAASLPRMFLPARWRSPAPNRRLRKAGQSACGR